MNKLATIRARHIKRTIIQNGKEVPVEMDFTDKAWKALGTVVIDGVRVPKQGFVQVSKVPTPPEAKSAKAPTIPEAPTKEAEV